MRTTTYLSAFLILSLFISACTTTPYVRHKTPKISGEIMVNQLAASGIQVYLSTDGNDVQCLKALHRTVTDNQGRFSFASIKDHMSYTPLMSYYLDEWVICAEVLGQRRLIHSGNRYGMGSVIESLDLQCEFGDAADVDRPCRPVMVQ